MGRVPLRTRLAVASMHVSTLPPGTRYIWLFLTAVSSVFTLTTSVMLVLNPAHFALWWLATLLGAVMFIMCVTYHEHRNTQVNTYVDANMKVLDKEYRDLTDKYWREDQ